MIDDNFIRDRITELRMQKDVSEYKMSLDMGHSTSYIRSITSGKALPSMGEFLYMCEYFGITPAEFFDENIPAPLQLKELNSLAGQLPAEDIDALIAVAKQLVRKTEIISDYRLISKIFFHRFALTKLFSLSFIFLYFVISKLVQNDY